jgi:hypothetical protein
MAEAPTDRSAAMIESFAAGQAALWLSESLILALINAGVVEKDRMLEAVDVVIATKRAMAISGREPEIATASIAMLASISASIAAAQGGPGEAPKIARPRRRASRKPPASQ